MINKRIFSRVEPISCGCVQMCATNMPSHAELDEIFKDRPSKPIPKSVSRYVDRMIKLPFRPTPDLYDLVNGWKEK